MSSSGHTGETGHNAAQGTQSTFEQAGEAAEGLRKNINAFANEMNLDGKPAGKSHGGDGVHPDARKAGEALAGGAGKATGKAEEVINQNKRS